VNGPAQHRAEDVRPYIERAKRSLAEAERHTGGSLRLDLYNVIEAMEDALAFLNLGEAV
jgi:hypothetical protein